MSIRFPNANYPQAYDEDDMQKASDVPVNVAADNLSLTEAGAGYGPLLESAITGRDVVTDPRAMTPTPKTPEPAEAPVIEDQ